MATVAEFDPSQVDLDTSKDELLLAAAYHDLPTVRALLRSVSANVQDPDTGYTPLHAATAACKPEQSIPSEPHTNGHLNGDEAAEPQQSIEYKETIELAEKTLRILFQNGAIWNDVDNNNETPGCLARRLGLQTLYDMVVDAGVRAELLLSRLDEYQPLPDEDEDEAEQNENDSQTNPSQGPTATTPTFSSNRLLDAHSKSLTISLETTIMRRTASLLLPRPGLRVLNIGHGTGLFDSLVQDTQPAAHHIIEADAAVLSKMRADGWTPSPSTKYTNVTVHTGRWQDVLQELVAAGTTFDAIFFDTFAQPYAALRAFFNEHAVALLEDGGACSFVHGLGADREVSYDVYTKVVEMDLIEAGFDVEWERLHGPRGEEQEREGGSRRYWGVERYRLPVCRFVG